MHEQIKVDGNMHLSLTGNLLLGETAMLIGSINRATIIDKFVSLLFA